MYKCTVISWWPSWLLPCRSLRYFTLTGSEWPVCFVAIFLRIMPIACIGQKTKLVDSWTHKEGAKGISLALHVIDTLLALLGVVFFLAWDVRIHRKGCPLLRLLSRRAFVECDCFWIAKCFDCRREQAWRRHDQMPCPRSRRVYLAVRQRFLWYFYPLWSIHINDWVCCTNDSVIYIYVEFIVFLHNQLQVVCCHSLRASSAWVSIVKSLSSQWLQ